MFFFNELFLITCNYFPLLTYECLFSMNCFLLLVIIIFGYIEMVTNGLLNDKNNIYKTCLHERDRAFIYNKTTASFTVNQCSRICLLYDVNYI